MISWVVVFSDLNLKRGDILNLYRTLKWEKCFHIFCFILTTFLSSKLNRCVLPQFADEQTEALNKLNSKFPKQMSDEARTGIPVQHFLTVSYLRHISDTGVSDSNP